MMESPQPARGNDPDQATSPEMTEQSATTHGMPGIQSRIDTSKAHGELMAGSDVHLSCTSLTPLKLTSTLRKIPSIQDLAMNDDESDLETVKLEFKDDSLIILSDDLKPARRTKLNEVYSSGHEAIFDLSQGGTRYFLMRCSSVKEVLEAQKTNIWPTSTLYHDKLQSAFTNSAAVRLVFTVHMSREFCGVAEMTSAIGWHQEAKSIFDVSKHRQCMKISWISKSTVPYDRILQKLQLPVYAVIFRNGQELPTHIGESVCFELIQQSSNDSRPTEIDSQMQMKS
ncbi:3'-5' RNA helicase ythdc2 [Podila verticillata]|nr:3'-5' RNA helicase ythdc2 [Podila verticillata]